MDPLNCVCKEIISLINVYIIYYGDSHEKLSNIPGMQDAPSSFYLPPLKSNNRQRVRDGSSWFNVQVTLLLIMVF